MSPYLDFIHDDVLNLGSPLATSNNLLSGLETWSHLSSLLPSFLPCPPGTYHIVRTLFTTTPNSARTGIQTQWDGAVDPHKEVGIHSFLEYGPDTVSLDAARY
jgi:hypothetical protein